MSPSTASEVFFGSIAFPLHLSLWVLILKNVPGKNRQVAEEELNTTTLEELRVQHNSDWELKRAGTIHKSESEYSLGLNRSESIAFNLNQYGRPCFMTYSFRDVVNGLISENKDLLIAVGSFAFIHYAGSADATSNIDWRMTSSIFRVKDSSMLRDRTPRSPGSSESCDIILSNMLVLLTNSVLTTFWPKERQYLEIT